MEKVLPSPADGSVNGIGDHGDVRFVMPNSASSRVCIIKFSPALKIDNKRAIFRLLFLLFGVASLLGRGLVIAS